MGYIRHHAIIVTGTYEDHAERAHAKAREVFATHAPGGWPAVHFVSPLTADGTNGTQSFAVFPDGSKEGWSESDVGDAARKELIAYLEAQAYEDGSSPLAWVEVQYGDDNGDTRIIRDSDEHRRPPRTR